MSIVTYREGVLAADTLVTADGGQVRDGYVSKIAQSPGGAIGGGAGPLAIAQTYLHLIRSGRIDEWIDGGFKDRLDLGAEKGEFEGILITPDATVVRVDWRGVALIVEKPYYAIGSGGWFAQGAMAAGAPAPVAADLAMRFDTCCGGQIETMLLPSFEASLEETLPKVSMEETGSEHEAERRVMDVGSAQWDGTPYSLALELKRLLQPSIDEGTRIDSGHGLLFPPGAPEPIQGHAEADLWPRVGGVEFYVTIRKSNRQLIKEGVTPAQLGLPDEPRGDGLPTPETPHGS